ncbi:biotin-dependent carboxyltransferase family protein [Ottowia thiooxydans]|uniref:Antagonist of KipI n=1 Tax=Ottowia thiooxydans TaxID=219182 RepID=A0ABV2QEW4_9BURK
MIVMNVVRAGLLSTYQDLGRVGQQCFGVPVNGPMDEWSHRLANALVGNSPQAAVLECAITGPRVTFSGDVVVALCGATMDATVDGQPLPYQTAVYVRRDAVLDLGKRHSGAYAYLAVRGALDVPAVLGSRSTNTRARFGGFQGRALRKGDQVPFRPHAQAAPLKVEILGRQSGLALVPGRQVAARQSWHGDAIRFVPGPQWSLFTPESRAAFTTQRYSMSPQSDRMGTRLSGTAINLERPLEMISEATVYGTVQVPPDGQPIVLMADRQSAGGYPKIAYVASADLPSMAQRLPGDEVRFEAITQEAAEVLWRSFETELADACMAAAAALD